jgi:nucleotidyltransferase substrate binding protein (TIGR01987 family)
MMANADIRWVQRFSNFSKALKQLNKFIEKGKLNELEKQGLIQAFEYTFELAWNTIKDYFEAQGETEIHGSRDAFKLAFNRGIIEKGETWMDMIKSRSLTSHTYNEEVAEKIASDIEKFYVAEFAALHDKFEQYKKRAK